MTFIKPFLVFAVLGVLSVAAGIPAQEGLIGRLHHAVGTPDLPRIVWALIVLWPSALLAVVGAAIGVLLAERVGLRSVVMSAIRGAPRPDLSRETLGMVALVGFALALGTLALDVGVLGTALGSSTYENDYFLQKRLLTLLGNTLLYGGIAEEIVARFGLLTLLVWLVAVAAPGLFDREPRWALGSAILLSAILFGVGRLLIETAWTPINLEASLRIVSLGTLAGLTYGWVYVKFGLEHAMLAHMATYLGYWTFAPIPKLVLMVFRSW